MVAIVAMAGATMEGTNEKAPESGAGAGETAWAFATAATLDMTARMVTAELTNVLEAIALIADEGRIGRGGLLVIESFAEPHKCSRLCVAQEKYAR